jgi:hypothetical protein
MCGKLQDSLNLLTRNPEFLDQLIDAHVLKVLEYRRYGRASASEYPRTTTLAGNALHSGAL